MENIDNRVLKLIERYDAEPEVRYTPETSSEPDVPVLEKLIWFTDYWLDLTTVYSMEESLEKFTFKGETYKLSELYFALIEFGKRDVVEAVGKKFPFSSDEYNKEVIPRINGLNKIILKNASFKTLEEIEHGLEEYKDSFEKHYEIKSMQKEFKVKLNNRMYEILAERSPFYVKAKEDKPIDEIVPDKPEFNSSLQLTQTIKEKSKRKLWGHTIGLGITAGIAGYLVGTAVADSHVVEQMNMFPTSNLDFYVEKAIDVGKRIVEEFTPYVKPFIDYFKNKWNL